MERRNMIGIILVAIILISVCFLIIYRDSFFSSKITREYPDGCVETYINKELISDKCIIGREIVNRTEPLIDYDLLEWESPTDSNLIVPESS